MSNSEEKSWTNKKVDHFVVVNNVLGKGAFGKVYRGFCVEDENKLVAAKAIPIKSISDSGKMLELIKREIAILQKVSSPFIVSLYDVARTSNNLYMFLEYCHDGDLKEYLKKKEGKRLSEPEALIFFRHIVEGFKELQKHKIIHRDIKPANIMLSNGIAKISDFGFSRVVEKDDPALLSRLGSPLYMTPQILDGVPFNFKCDVWSVGVVFFEMLYGTTPWIGDSQVKLLQNIKSIPLKFPENPIRSKEVKDLLRGMLKVKEEERMSWEEIFNHPLIKDYTTPALAKEPAPNKDDLEQSVSLNDNYIKKNLVAGYLTNPDTVQTKGPDAIQQNILKKQEQQTTSSTQQSSQMTSKMEQSSQKVNEIVNKQKENEQTRKNILKINEYILYERNIAFFSNFVIQKLIKAYNDSKLQVPADLYFRIIFSICKYQNMQLDKMNEFLNQSKTEGFSEQVWQKYKESTEYQTTVKLIRADIDHSKNFFEELFKKTKDVVTHSFNKETNKDKQEVLNKFLGIIDKTFTLDNKFKSIFKATLNEMIETLKPQIINGKPDKEILVIARYLIVCNNPYLEFKISSFDFNKFYEDIEHISEEEIRKQVLEKFNQKASK
ncbi:dual-specificity kinase domain protein (macronuclear) [Tetrahymena thermophila SB210]|uniref:Dual-specificity kinase domain protein n=1 Tax=Tetrahymena thermophila (strain SB210) TaxID=312017 RepID=I7M1H9_TETTS|nr:dual-specificity kinase domain protein [Tetrahymena thermophila SB210]EAR96377.2 dual-specificity kinase domain protein [Tetrahymena thermophila SB210]|eukprot:XP_001016622.2 dual-specificity kinase domain protein [Tetrahymena thermophila SB210]